MVRFAFALLAFMSFGASAAVHVYWTPSPTDIDGNVIDQEIILYHVWVWRDSDQGFVDYMQTAETEIIIDLAEGENSHNRCFPIRVTAERTDAGLQSDPSGTVQLCFDGTGDPYDGDNPPDPEDPDVLNGSRPVEPVISIQVIDRVDD